MKKYKIYVDGREGTTGLQIMERLAEHPYVEILEIPAESRKERKIRADFINRSDITFLCLPDQAAREAVQLVQNPNVRIIDASTAHRTDPEWVYGFPELGPGHRKKIARAARIAVPGCHATGFTAAVQPLRAAGVILESDVLCSHSVTGYSGGGKLLIQKYRDTENPLSESMQSPRLYALSLSHKHLPEMTHVNGLRVSPLFTPIVGAFYKGMLVTTFLPFASERKFTASKLHRILSDYYMKQTFIRVLPLDFDFYTDRGFVDATGCNETNRLDIFVCGGEERTAIVCRLDNLGKGSSGAAVQCMNIMLGIPEDESLKIF